MSIARNAIAEHAIAQNQVPVIRTKTPSKRIYVALADTEAVPEPR